jgi:hypothetical protein
MAALSGEVADKGRGATDRGEYRQAAGAIARVVICSLLLKSVRGMEPVQ